jgi:aspartate kinase
LASPPPPPPPPARVAALRSRGWRPVVVVSAAGRTTDRILARLAAVGAREPGRTASRERDRALATGEDRSAALLAHALMALGVEARSLRGAEAGIRAAGPHGAGRIGDLDVGPLRALLEASVVPVVSGFQAGRADGETLTLGRGGSDTSAVALAAALGPVPCLIVTDVDGVYDRDPRLHADARRHRHLGHAALLRLALGGAAVIHPDAARIAHDAAVPLAIHHHRAPLAGATAGTRVGAWPAAPIASVATVTAVALEAAG